MKRLVAAVSLALLLSTAAVSEEYLGDFTDPQVCLTQEESTAAINIGMPPGTVIEYHTDEVMVFSNPTEPLLYKLRFTDGCAGIASTIDVEEFKAFKETNGF